MQDRQEAALEGHGGRGSAKWLPGALPPPLTSPPCHQCAFIADALSQAIIDGQGTAVGTAAAQAVSQAGASASAVATALAQVRLPAGGSCRLVGAWAQNLPGLLSSQAGKADPSSSLCPASQAISKSFEGQPQQAIQVGAVLWKADTSGLAGAGCFALGGQLLLLAWSTHVSSI